MKHLIVKISLASIILFSNIHIGFSQEIDRSLLDFFQHVPENSKDNFSFLLPDHILEFLQNGDDRSLGKIAENSKFTFSRDLAYAAKARVVGDINESNRYLENIINDKYKNKKLTLEILLYQAMLAGNYIQQNRIKMWADISKIIYEETEAVNRITGGKPFNFSQILPVNFLKPHNEVKNTYLDGEKESVLEIKKINNDDHIFFNSNVNNSIETSILDTGLYISVFPERFINRSDVHIIGKTKTSDIFGNTKESYLAQIDSITVGNSQVKNLLVQITKGVEVIIMGENFFKLFKNVRIDEKKIYLNKDDAPCRYNLLEGSILNGVYSSPRISAYIDHIFYSSIVFDLGMAFDKHTSLLDRNITPIVFLFDEKNIKKQEEYVNYKTFVEKNVGVEEHHTNHDLILQKDIFRSVGSLYVNKEGVKNYIIINRDILKMTNVNISYVNKKICFTNKK